jgi:hypothetical protein
MNCECQVVCEGCENNERDSDSNTRARYTSVAFYHHTDNEVDGEVQGAPSRLCKCGMDVWRLQRVHEQGGDDECRLNERWLYG